MCLLEPRHNLVCQFLWCWEFKKEHFCLNFNILQSFPHREEARRSASAFFKHLVAQTTKLHYFEVLANIFLMRNEKKWYFFFVIDFRAFKHHLDLVTKPLSDRKTTLTECCTGVMPRACHSLSL